jgi:HK97 family phage prohead protease
MPVKAFAFEVKELTATGQFSGFASTYDDVDLTDDQVMPGAFTRTLAEAGKQRPLLWMHSAPIGLVQLADSVKGLVADGQLSMDVQLAKDTYSLMRDGVVKGLSIGFQTIKQAFVGDVRQLLEVKLFEVSLTAIPANEQAVIFGVKTAQLEQEHQRKIRVALKSFRSEILGALKK